MATNWAPAGGGQGQPILSASRWAGLERDAPSAQMSKWRPSLSQTDVPTQTKWDFFLPPGAKERARQQKKHGSFEDELSEILGQQKDQAALKGQCWPVWPESGEGGRRQ